MAPPQASYSIDALHGFELTEDGQYLMLNSNQPDRIALHCSVMHELLAALSNAIGSSERIRHKQRGVKFVMPCEAWTVGRDAGGAPDLILSFRLPGGAPSCRSRSAARWPARWPTCWRWRAAPPRPCRARAAARCNKPASSTSPRPRSRTRYSRLLRLLLIRMNARSLSSRRLRYLTFAGLGVTSVTACAADPFTISDIRIEGLQRIEPGSVFAYLPMKQGDTYNDDLASEAIRKLYATGFFNDVKVATEGTVVIVQVQERPAISSIDFSGIKEFDKDNLTKALTSVGLARGRYYDKSLVDKAEQELKRQYLTRGYYAAEVTTNITPVDANRVSILFSVAEGPSAKIRQVNFIGNHTFKTSTPARRDAAVDAELVLLVHQERPVLEGEAHGRPGERALVLPRPRLPRVQFRLDPGVDLARQEGHVPDHHGA